MKYNHLFLGISACLLMSAGQVSSAQEVKVEPYHKSIPTYRIGEPEKDPYFFTGRVYQGAEGYIYPYKLYDVLSDVKEDKDYELVRLSNEYVDLSILPEIGGRIFEATDLTDGYHFFYTQTGIKPALIGMLGAWLSGGVEWNIPDHHRATSYLPVDWTTRENPDGSKTVWVGETDLRHGLVWAVGVTVFPNSSRVQATVKVINPTPSVQSMLYWANVSVHCGSDYQVIFPPDVEFGADHHKVYFTHWPYGAVDRAEKINADLSRWSNFTVDTRSIFAWGSRMSFLAGYDYGVDAGTVHVANRFQVPGKKFFLWGNNPTGELWDKILSDNDGPYLELMVGAYSDNQPDYSWIAPGEIREFTQTWFPVKGIKGVKNATEFAAVNLERVDETTCLLGFNASVPLKGAHAVLYAGSEKIFDKTIDIDPDKFFLENVTCPRDIRDSELKAVLTDAEGNVMVEYVPVEKGPEKELPKVIDGTKPVGEYETVEELYLAGLRADQFNNARLNCMDFYEEALRRDSMDARVNIEVAKNYISKGLWNEAEKHLLRANARLEHDYTKPYNTEAEYLLGCVYVQKGMPVLAEECFWAATYTPSFKHPAYCRLAEMAACNGNLAEALKLIDEALLTGGHDLRALGFKMNIQRRLGMADAARETHAFIKAINPLDYLSAVELGLLDSPSDILGTESAVRRSGGLTGVQELLEIASFLMSAGDRDAAVKVLDAAVASGEHFRTSPMIRLYKAWLAGDESAAREEIAAAAALPANDINPLRVSEISMYEELLAVAPECARLHYGLGNLLYYLGQRTRATEEWREASRLDPNLSLAARNVGFALSQEEKYEEAIRYYDLAIKADPSDPLLFTESDRVCEKAGVSAAERMNRLEAGIKTVMKHDDAVMRLLQTYNSVGKYDKAIKIMNTRHFHLWEGGGGIHDIYVMSHVLKGKQLMERKQYEKAKEEFRLATLYPANLEVPAPAENVSIRDIIASMKRDLDDSYAKFGDEDAASRRKSLEELERMMDQVEAFK